MDFHSSSLEITPGCYWQQMIFSGQSIPPVEFDTEKEVIDYVVSHLNAVAYVFGKFPLKSKVKNISWK